MRKSLLLPLLILPTLILVPVVSTQAAHASDLRGMACGGASPQVTVRQYYQAVVRHQADLALSCFTSRTRGLMQQNVMPDWRNVASVRSLHLRVQAVPAAALPGYAVTGVKPYAVSRVVAAYVVRYYHTAKNLANGKARRTIYVVKQQRTSPWRIAAIS